MTEPMPGPEQPAPLVPQPSPLPVVFDVNPLLLQGGGIAQPAVRMDTYTAAGVHAVFLSAAQAVQLAAILMEEAKNARKIPNIAIASEMPNGHGPLA